MLVMPYSGEHYQEFLYRSIGALGVKVRYTKGPTPSQTLNLILAPAVLVWNRARGTHILHIHWLFQFSLPWARRQPWARWLMERWFRWYLRIAQVLGYKIVWTAHDLLPHEQIFTDDIQARAFLLSRTSAVIALSDSTASELRSLGACSVDVVPLGQYSEPHPIVLTREQARGTFGFSPDDVVLSLIGRIEEYKGADLLVSAAAELASSSKIRVLIAGTCPDEQYREKLNYLIGKSGGRVASNLEWIPDEDLARFYQATDFAVIPFREISNSASLLLAQSFGKPIVIPDLPALRDIPASAAIRFNPREDSLADVLRRLEQISETEYLAVSSAGHDWATRFDWPGAARMTVGVYEEVLRR